MRGSVAIAASVVAAVGLTGCPGVSKADGGPVSTIDIFVLKSPENGEVYTQVYCTGAYYGSTAYYLGEYMYGQEDVDGDGYADDGIKAKGVQVAYDATTSHLIPIEEGLEACEISYAVSIRTADGGTVQKPGRVSVAWPPTWETMGVEIGSSDPDDATRWTATTDQEAVLPF